jgi:hypothetical protein
MIIILIVILLLILYWCITTRETFQSEETQLNSYQDCGKCCYNKDYAKNSCWYKGQNSEKKYCRCEQDESKTQKDCMKCCDEKPEHKCYRYGYVKDVLTRIYCDCPRFKTGSTQIVDSTFNLNLPGGKCPNSEKAPMCPIGTLACSTNKKYCYYPDKNAMVSTYFLPEYDYCPNENRGKANGIMPFQINDINVWMRGGGGKDMTCPNIKLIK